MTANEALQQMGLTQNKAPVKTGKQFNGTIVYEVIKSKDRVCHGQKYEGSELKGHKAVIMPGEYIQIYGQEWNHIHAPVDFDRTFNIGDEAEYDSYNLKYTGKIVAIGVKTITINAGDTGKGNVRLSIYDFSWRNWDFDAVKIAKDNFETMITL